MTYELNSVTPEQRKRVEQLLFNPGITQQFQESLDQLLNEYSDILPAVTSEIRNIAYGGKPAG